MKERDNDQDLKFSDVIVIDCDNPLRKSPSLPELEVRARFWEASLMADTILFASRVGVRLCVATRINDIPLSAKDDIVIDCEAPRERVHSRKESEES